ncbi:MAG: FkbM family methyltransferase [Bacteroidota bacterium]
MKNLIKYILQKLLGINTYLYVFAKFIIRKLENDKKEKDFIFFLNLIPDNGIVLDIGANLGIMTVHLSKKLKNSTIFAFEPMPQNLITLNRIINHYKLNNVNVIDCALGDKSGEIEMVMPVVKSVKMQGLSHVVHDSITDFNEGIKLKVLVKKLDDYEELKQAKITAIKLDVENFEYFVLKGGENIIKSNQPLIYCELWDNENRQKCFDLVRSLGYKIYFLDDTKKELINIDNQKTEKQNFFFKY